MLKNYIKVAVRALLRHKHTSFINIFGLGLGMSCGLLIYLFVQDELSYDRHHTKAERIYRVTRSFHSADGEVNLHLANVAPPIGALLKNDFGEIELSARTLNFNTVISLEEDGETKVSNSEEKLFAAEPAILQIMDINVASGDPASALARPFTVMLSRKTAQRYFNTDNVLGRRLRSNNQFDLEITGVFDDFPKQSHWHPEFLVSFSTLENDAIYGRTRLETNWGNNAFGTYLLLSEGAETEKLESRFPAFLDTHFGNIVKTEFGAPSDFVASKTTTLTLQKLTDIHLRSHLDDEIETNGNIQSVYMMSAIGTFIILIACFNFINLSTARASKRSKEVGLRKVAGAFRAQLITQYLSESVLITFTSLVVALALASAGIEWVNGFTGKDIPVNALFLPQTVVLLIAFAIVIGLAAGIYPAFFISSYKPVISLKGDTSHRGNTGLRRGLVIAQFSISIFLMIATATTFQQLDYVNKMSLGYNKDQVITLPIYAELTGSYEPFYNELTGSSLIQNLSRSSRVPTGRLLDSYGNARVIEGDSLTDSRVSLKTIAVDADFFDTYDIEITAGRNFSKDIVTDDSLSFMINESGARALGWENYEKHINEAFEYAGVRGRLIGVVKDFHFESLHQSILPMIFVGQNRYNVLSVRIAGNHPQEAIALIEQKWKEYLPGRPFDYTFLNQRYASLYDAEQKQGKLFTSFSLLAIFIACLGLFGLATFNTMQRVKEIGIRKVMGATVPQILGLLSKETVVLTIAAHLIAVPVGLYFMNKWLANFAYHITPDPIVLILSGVVAIVVAILTVSAQTIRAARANPARTLKYE
jgi:putative ABC transport system permease protein